MLLRLFKRLSQVVPVTESSFYRVLKAVNQQHHRGRSQRPTRRRPTSHCAIAPNQLWSWDITYLNAAIRGKHYYLYMVLDVYSRKIVTWEIHTEESAEHASRMIQKACMQQKISLLERPLVLHSDNGSPMKGATMLSTLQQLGVHTSFSRPRVSNDNPFSESGFQVWRNRKWSDAVYQQAKSLRPERWGRRNTRNWDLPVKVWLNPERSGYEQQQNLVA